MAKKNKLKTPDWVLEGFDSEADYNKKKGIKDEKKLGKSFNIKRCPKCNSDEVGVVIGENGIWECHKCKWKGRDVVEKELTEDELMKYMDERKEAVA